MSDRSSEIAEIFCTILFCGVLVYAGLTENTGLGFSAGLALVVVFSVRYERLRSKPEPKPRPRPTLPETDWTRAFLRNGHQMVIPLPMADIPRHGWIQFVGYREPRTNRSVRRVIVVNSEQIVWMEFEPEEGPIPDRPVGTPVELPEDELSRRRGGPKS